MPEQFNPLDKINLGKSVAEALLEAAPDSLGDIKQFDGAGIYAIYYNGGFPPYGAMAKRNAKGCHWPIYIGKAIPSGGRKGAAVFSAISGRHVWGRLREHAESIRAASNLDIEDFKCRYLIVDDIWIPLGETLLIAHFKPVWNLALDGFGNHDPGAGRYGGQRPVWDVLHPGRAWAAKCATRSETPVELSTRIADFLSKNPPADSHMRFEPPAKT
ncbi:Eco29kI family restriction endonuclease [Bradyrhizobium japonicum]|uniref:Eco29kI family restriction endonuclease n=1 Tax=Bradyrhizobium japonicum TaxID=375 RepID=UPI001B8A4AE4|nr:Eco29kI family restriction endonuclease [Bradyrhizobium japonicum]